MCGVAAEDSVGGGLAFAFQQGCQFCVALCFRHHGGSFAFVVGRFGIGSVLEEQFHHGAISVLGGGVNRGPTEVLAGVDWGAVFEEQADGGQVSGGSSGVEGHHSHGISGHYVNPSAVLKENSRSFGLAKKAG